MMSLLQHDSAKINLEGVTFIKHVYNWPWETNALLSNNEDYYAHKTQVVAVSPAC